MNDDWLLKSYACMKHIRGLQTTGFEMNALLMLNNSSWSSLRPLEFILGILNYPVVTRVAKLIIGSLISWNLNLNRHTAQDVQLERQKEQFTET